MGAFLLPANHPVIHDGHTMFSIDEVNIQNVFIVVNTICIPKN